MSGEPRPDSERRTDSPEAEYRWDRRWHRDPISAWCWAALFIWTGLGLLAHTTGWGRDTYAWWNTWAVILAGAGAILVLCALVRLVVPRRRRPFTGNLIVGFVLLGVGLGALTNWGAGTILAFVLIAIGLVIILGGLFRRR